MTERNKISYNYANRGWPPTSKPWTPGGVLDEYRPVTPDSKSDQVYDEQILSVRRGTFKLMHNPDPARSLAEPVNDYVLVDVLADPKEEYNLYRQLPETAKELESLLEGWWRSILLEPGSFNMPAFSVYGQDDQVTTVPAKAPYRTSSNVESAFNWLANWTRPGDLAEYKLDVKTPGIYQVTLIFEGDPSGAEMRVSSGEKSVSNVLSSSGEAEMGRLELNRSDTLLRLELIQNGRYGRAFKKLHAIELQKQ